MEKPLMEITWKQRWTDVLIITGMCCIALGVRVYRLEEQSLWFDDFNGWRCLECNDLKSYMACVYSPEPLNTQQMPLYYVVEYAWSRIFGTAPLTVRYLSVFLGIITIPFIYCIARPLFGRGAGYLACLFYVLSPSHIFYDQAIRAYSLIIFLSSISIYALLQAARRGGGHWWLVSFAANAMLIGTHIFTVFLVLVQGCWLLLAFRKSPRACIVWVVAHGVVIAGGLLWLMGNLNQPESAYVLFRAPDLRDIIVILFGQDAVGPNIELMPSGETWPFLSPETARHFIACHVLFDIILQVLFAASVWVCLYWALAEESSSIMLDGIKAVRAPLMFLAMIAVLPALILAILSHAWRPCIFPRYTLYSSLALYVLAAGMLTRLKPAALRCAAITVAIATYGYQASLLLPAATRTQWNDAAAWVRAELQEGDIVLAGSAAPDSLFGVNSYVLFNLYFQGRYDILTPAYTPQYVVDVGACYLRDDAMSRQRRIWAVLSMNYNVDLCVNFEECLAERGLQFIRRDFTALEGLRVYCITADPTREPLPPEAQQFVTMGVDHEALLAEIAFSPTDPLEKRRTLTLLRRICGIQPRGAEGFAALSSVALREPGGATVGLAFARRALRDAPENLQALFNMGVGLLLCDEKDVAYQYFQEALDKIDPMDRAPLATFLEAACGKPDSESARKTMIRLREEWSELSSPPTDTQVPAWLQTPVGIDIPPTLLHALGFQVPIYSCPISP